MFEFVVILPVLLLLIFGVIEFGRYVFYYSTISLAVRDGARYGSSATEYKDCAGIRASVLNVGKFSGMVSGDISLHYEEESTGTILYATCVALASTSNDGIEFGDRIVVRAQVTVQPLVSLVNLPPITFSSKAEKSIATNIALPDN